MQLRWIVYFYRIMSEATLVARFLHSLPTVFAVTGTPRDVQRVVASLRHVITARSLQRRLRLHLLHALQLLIQLECGTLTIAELERAIGAVDLAECEHHNWHKVREFV